MRSVNVSTDSFDATKGNPMNISAMLVRWRRVPGVWLGFILALTAMAAEHGTVLPEVLQAGFVLYPKGGAELALDAWRKGGLADERGERLASQIAYFKQTERAVGNYRSYEVIDIKPVSASSKVLYLAVNFERGVIFARFMIYRTERDWVVQTMDFNTRPETLMPWLSLSGSGGTE